MKVYIGQQWVYPLAEDYPTISQCLSFDEDGSDIISIAKTDSGYRLAGNSPVLSDVALTQEQFERWIGELQELAGLKEDGLPDVK